MGINATVLLFDLLHHFVRKYQGIYGQADRRKSKAIKQHLYQNQKPAGADNAGIGNRERDKEL